MTNEPDGAQAAQIYGEAANSPQHRRADVTVYEWQAAIRRIEKLEKENHALNFKINKLNEKLWALFPERGE